MKALIRVVLLLGLSACGGNDGVPEGEVVDSTATAASTVLDLARYDAPLLVELGDMATLGVDTPTVKWNEEFGHLEVNAGEHFGLLITEEPGDLARLKADLDRDMLRKHTVIEETPEKLVYRSEFPDDAGTYIHFYRMVQVGDRIFVVTDAEQRRFNEADVKRMSGSIKAKVAA
ncbi:MAG TPA: hypothetical protein PL070_03510 [Flavobacteriales bacterium]|nr:hypothetical protein [Flavobacteriales bacterium]